MSSETLGSSRVLYGNISSPPFQVVTSSAHGFDATVDRLKQGIEALGLWLIHEINPTMLLARGGYEIAPARQLLYFHARYAERLLRVDPAAVVEIPLKLVVLQAPDGSVSVRHADVRAQFARYPGMEALADELAELARQLTASISPRD